MSKTYITAQGDTWDSIAFTQMGDVCYTDRLMMQNSAFLAHYIFPPGIRLELPEVDSTPAQVLPPWKQVQG